MIRRNPEVCVMSRVGFTWKLRLLGGGSCGSGLFMFVGWKSSVAKNVGTGGTGADVRFCW